MECTVPFLFSGIPYMNNQPTTAARVRSARSARGGKPASPITKAGKALAKQKRENKALNKALRPQGITSKLETVPVARSRFITTGSPKQKTLPNGDVIVEHREFLQNIVGSQAFSVSGRPVNPGQGQTFPWLQYLAALYESYRFEFLEFEYQNTCGSSTDGLVMLAIDYDASDPAPGDKVTMATYRGYARDAAWKDFRHHSIDADLHKLKSNYVRPGALSANQDIKLYDVGNMFIATEGMAGATTVGELYVNYKVRLMTPQLGSSLAGLSKSARFTSGTAANSAVAVTGSNAPVAVSGDSINGITFTALAPFSALVTCVFQSTSGASAIVTTGSTCTIESVNSLSGTPNGNYFAQISMLPGQTLIFNNTNPGNATVQLAQFNTAVL